MKILIATGIYPPDIGGPATYSKLLMDELPKISGLTATVLSYGSVKHLPKGISHLAYFFQLLKLSKNVDVIYAQDTFSVGLPSALAAKLLCKKFVLRVPGDYAWEQAVQRFGVKEGIDEFQNKKYPFKIEFLRKLQKLTANLADLIITPSSYFQKLVFGWVKNSDKVKMIYNGIKLKNREILPWTGREKVLVSAGRLVPWKGFDFLIDLMRDLPDYCLEIYGNGPDYRSLEEKISALKLSERVFLKGQIAREELLAVLSRSFAFVFNSSFESFSFQVVEAMNAGTPVIAAAVGNLNEIISSEREGFLVKAGEREGFLAAINKIAGDPVLAKLIIFAAGKKAETFSIEKTLDRLIAECKSLIQQ